MSALRGVGLGLAAGGAAVGVEAGAKALGATHYALSDADVARLREIQTAAHERVVEMRSELEALEAELAVLDEALAEAQGSP